MPHVIAIGPGGKPQAPERADHFREVIDAVRAAGMLDQKILSPRCRDYEHADDVRRGIFRSARYYCSCGGKNCARRWKNIPSDDNPEGGCPDGGQRISCRAEVVSVTDENGKKHYCVQFQLHDKREALRAVVAKYGPDPNNWPYYSRAKRAKGKDDG